MVLKYGGKLARKLKTRKVLNMWILLPVHPIKSSIVKQSKGRLYNYYLRWVNTVMNPVRAVM
ncbi:hypothetical protein Barb6XT_02032 [Bacteroidales bacterium Barb6XT]|nr:hypothetical protein Barb6XT_02032 [Bacteroidales bacterium Barb6XT]